MIDEAIEPHLRTEFVLAAALDMALAQRRLADVIQHRTRAASTPAVMALSLLVLWLICPALAAHGRRRSARRSRWRGQPR